MKTKNTNFRLGTPVKKDRRSLFALFAAIVVLVVLLLGSYKAYVRHQESKRAETQKTQNESQNNSAKNNTTKSANDDPVSKNIEDTKKSTSITSDQIPVSDKVEISINTFEQSGNQINVGATIDNNSSPGVCVFSFELPEEKPIIKQVDSQPDGCSTIFSRVQFSRIGQWNLSVVFYQGNSKAQAQKNVTIN